MTPQERLNQAVFYALKEGCFFPVPRPDPNRGANTREWIQWGAMQNLHAAIRMFHLATLCPAPPKDQV